MAYTTIDKSSLHFNTKLYTGNGANNHAITGVGFAPDFTWIKARANTYDHMIFDSLRGTNVFRYGIRSNLNGAQDTGGNSDLLTLDSDGFTLGTGGYVNNSVTFASWNWKAGTTSGISAGSQTITPSSYSINTTAGFGIYKWSRTGASTTDYFSHGLGATPTIAIQKRTDGAQDWYVNTTIIDGTNDNLHLNNTNVKEDDSTNVPTSTNYYPKSPETGDYITYLFTPKQGYSSFGKYLGNGNANGSFIYTGMKVSWIMIKKVTGSGNAWIINDNKRPTYNGNTGRLEADSTGAETSSTGEYAVDLLSNGFKFKGTGGGINSSGETYIYMAFAEAPLVGSNNVPATAR